VCFIKKNIEYAADRFVPVNGFPAFKVQQLFQIRT
jgi:hypothetical protein